MKTTGFRDHICWICIPVFFSLIACERIDEILSGDRWCTSGIPAPDVPAHLVPDTARVVALGMPANYIGVSNPLYQTPKRMVIIPFEFATAYPRNPAVTEALIRDNFFSVGTGSVRDYFRENSYGQFDVVEGVITPWVTLSHDPAYYAAGMLGGDWSRNHDLARELCHLGGIDWRMFDLDHDYRLDRRDVQIFFLCAAEVIGAERPATVTVHTPYGSFEIANDFVYADCKRMTLPDNAINPISYNFGTIWHELCHGLFNLPDRYIDFCGSGFTGQYDIMSDPCSWRMMNMFDKVKLGWVTPRILEKPVYRPDSSRHCYALRSSENNPEALILYDRRRPDQYWIVENRYKPASPLQFDKDLPESGLAIWWINATNNEVHLVDANEPTRHPQTYRYYATGGWYWGALFKGDESSTDTTVYTTYLSSSSGDLSFLVRAISPPGPTMYIEF